MFDIGFMELIIIAIISLLVLGPERLPVAARQAGRWVGKARRMVSQFSREIDRQVEIEELRAELKKQAEPLDIEAEANQIHQTVQAALAEAEDYDQPSHPKKEFEPLPRDDEPSQNQGLSDKQSTEINETDKKH